MQIKQMVAMRFHPFHAYREWVAFVQTDFNEAVFFRYCFQKNFHLISIDLLEREHPQLLDKKRLAKIADAILFLTRQWHHTQILIIIYLNQRFPSRVYHIEIPRPGIDIPVHRLGDAFIPLGFINLSLFQIGDHRQFSRIFRYISGHPAQRFCPPRVSLWVRYTKLPFTFLTSSTTLIISLYESLKLRFR